MALKQKHVVLTVVGLLLATTVVAGYFYVPWRSPREQYRADFNSKFDTIIEALNDMVNGKKQTKRKLAVFWTDEGGIKGRTGIEDTISMPEEIKARIQALQQHMSEVPYNFLQQDVAGFEEWVDKIRADYDRQHKRAQILIERIIREQGQESLSSYGFSETVGHSMQKIEQMLDIDMIMWLASLRKAMGKP